MPTESKPPTVTETAVANPAAESSTASAMKPARVEIWLGLIKYEEAVKGLKVGDVARFSGWVSDESAGTKVIVHLANRYDEANFLSGPKPTPVTAETLGRDFAANRDEALKTYVVPLGSQTGQYIIEGKLTELDESNYRVVIQ